MYVLSVYIILNCNQKGHY